MGALAGVFAAGHESRFATLLGARNPNLQERRDERAANVLRDNPLRDDGHVRIG